MAVLESASALRLVLSPRRFSAADVVARCTNFVWRRWWTGDLLCAQLSSAWLAGSLALNTQDLFILTAQGHEHASLSSSNVAKMRSATTIASLSKLISRKAPQCHELQPLYNIMRKEEKRVEGVRCARDGFVARTARVPR